MKFGLSLFLILTMHSIVGCRNAKSGMSWRQEMEKRLRIQYLGSTIDQLMKDQHIRDESVEMIDEPPGKLVGIVVPIQIDARVTRVILSIDYDPSLFSEERQWNLRVVKACRIRNITMED